MLNKFICCLSRFVDLKRPTIFEWLSIIISLFGLASLIFLVKQTTSMTLQTENIVMQTENLSAALNNSALTNISNREFEVNKILFENPQFIPYFFEGKIISKSDRDYNKVAALAGLRLAVVADVYEQASFIPRYKDDENPAWQVWTKYIHDMFSKSPIMCENLVYASEWFTRDFINFAKKGCPS